MVLSASLVEILRGMSANCSANILPHAYLITAYRAARNTQNSFSIEKILQELKTESVSVKIDQTGIGSEFSGLNSFIVYLIFRDRKDLFRLSCAFRGSYEGMEDCVKREIAALQSYGFNLGYLEKNKLTKRSSM